MKKALLQEKTDNKVQCKICSHFCLLSEGEIGKCGVKKNKNGKIINLNYGKVIARHLDPVEKKPLYHFFPGSKCFSIACPGCNFKCQNCQNWKTSQAMIDLNTINQISPEKLISEAVKKKATSIAYTYTEPTIFLEYALDVMKLAHKNQLKNIWVSNGFMSDQSIKKILPYLDGVNIDLKSFSNNFYEKICNGKLNPVLKSIELIYKNAWLEITTLLIPKYVTKKDLKNIASFISNLNNDIPWHVTSFSPIVSWKMKNIAFTSKKDLTVAQKIGKRAGLNYVYASKNSTTCPNCNEEIIKRSGYKIEKNDKNGRCPNCNQKIPLIQ